MKELADVIALNETMPLGATGNSPELKYKHRRAIIMLY